MQTTRYKHFNTSLNPLVERNVMAAPTVDPHAVKGGERIWEDMMLLLREFAAELAPLQSSSRAETSSSAIVAEKREQNGAVPHQQQFTPFGESEWLPHLELKFVLRTHRIRLLRALSRFYVSGGMEVYDTNQISVTKEALSVVEELLEKVEAHAQMRLQATDPSMHPLVLRLATRYGLPTAGGESDLFQLLFMSGASKSAAVRTTLGASKLEDKELAMELCGMSSLEVEEFLDDKRTHMAEGIIVTQFEYARKTFRMTNEAVSVLLLRPLKTEEWLKFSKTELLRVLAAGEGEPSSVDGAAPPAVSPTSDGGKNLKLEANSLERGAEVLESKRGSLQSVQERKFEDADDDLPIVEAAAQEGLLDAIVMKAVLDPEAQQAALSGDAGSSEPDASNESATTTAAVSSLKEDLRKKRDELSMYTSSLEYLDDGFQVLALMLRVAKARHKENMKEAFNFERPWYGHRSTKVSSVRELRAKLRFAQNRLQERMKLTEEACLKDGSGAQIPRLEALSRKLGLDDFEKGVVIMLTGVSISPVVKSIFKADDGDGGGYGHRSDSIQVKDILTVYFDSFKEQVLARTYFYKSSRLVARGLIKLRAGPYSRGGDLMDQQVELDRRILDWIVGLDTEMNELVEGSHLYKPQISMEQVVLPEEQKGMLLKTVENFAKFKQYKRRAGLEDLMSYGAGLVILLCGPSGTGKTMTVNAMAHHLGKRVLLVDFHSLHAATSAVGRDDHSADLRGLFRDADMNDAIIFFDECEAIFAPRERGGDRLLNSLLSEMERHEGIIMLATNRPLDLDEAMHRRITCVSEYHPPDHTQRRTIWKLASERLPVTDNVDWDKIALRYELTGGYIKNALVSALLTAISRDSVNPTMTEEDIVSGCALQMRGSLQMKTFTHRVVPKIGMDELILTSGMREKIDAIVAFEKARTVLLGQWGFQQERLGTACLFWGPHGTGKSSVAEAIGFELGRPLRVINCAQLISRSSNATTGANISSAFKDSRLLDAVMVLEDFQIFRAEAGVGSVSAWSHVAIGLLLYELGRFPGICILIANNVQGSVVHRLDPELTRRLKFLVEFKMPGSTVRAEMWQKLIPAKCPVAENINYEDLGRRFDFTSGTISSAIVRAAAKASLRSGADCILTSKDLVEAAEAELAHLRDEIYEAMLAGYT